jgi:hypothetical protein
VDLFLCSFVACELSGLHKLNIALDGKNWGLAFLFSPSAVWVIDFHIIDSLWEQLTSRITKLSVPHISV